MQNELILFRDEEGKPYSQTYLRTVQNQLSAILNHACRFYGLGSNVSTKVGKIGKARSSKMNFWTKDEFMNFSEVMKNRPKSYYAFQLLFLCSMRVGEVLALTPNDIKLDEKKIIISKSY
ncbi:site-specific integrase [Campylobacter pinnipediorum]|uniref:site-specific integrase n=1 Tax=Campylobacter pinnipediorum TaxID=1965231 RepID=UPI001C5B2209|nr:site-specific integrase [Campylobacter pinnipediorum]